MDNIVNLVSTVGFPTAACIAIFYLYNKCLTEIKDAIANNTRALTLLTSKLEVNTDKNAEE